MGRRERAAAALNGTEESEKRKKKRRRMQSTKGFEIVSADFSAAAAAAPPAAKKAKKSPASPSGAATAATRNTLREAHRLSTTTKKKTETGKKGSANEAAALKAEAIWFRKCGHGETLFKAYYRGQTDVLTDAEWSSLWATFQKPLPVSFRLHRDHRLTLEPEIVALSTKVVRAVSWAPPGAGIYQVVEKNAKSQDLAKFLVSSVEKGALNRQEVVSMLPVLALQVEKGEACLDLCASPGSKTMQLMEAVSSSDEHGIVLANDVCPKRLGTLQDALRRHSRTFEDRSHLVLTCHRGEDFPSPKRPFTDKIGFDKVLADVPCSGDGTIRKDRSVLPRWTPAISNQLHAVQLEIGWRGLQLLKVGGLMCYSTCSLNPIEDEAVVAALLARAKGTVTLEEWPAGLLPKLRRRPGVNHWKVATYEDDDEDEVKIKWHASYDEAVPHATPTLWPPKEADLTRCSRFLPQDQDTGGFFLALLRKHEETPCSSQGREEVSPVERPLAPLDGKEAAKLGSALGLTPAASRRRLLRKQPKSLTEAEVLEEEEEEEEEEEDLTVHVAPAALFTAYDPGDLAIAAAGVPLDEAAGSRVVSTDSEREPPKKKKTSPSLLPAAKKKTEDRKMTMKMKKRKQQSPTSGKKKNPPPA